jgi:GR25 family glycosyltransferase involved in LPS biosynthesis
VAYLGYYINLDRSADRRAAMETQLARLDPPARYQRFPAVDGNPRGIVSDTLTDADIGCLTSHYLLLHAHRNGDRHLHVIEDDAVLASRATHFVEQIIESGTLEQNDILFTSTVLSEKLEFFAGFYQEIRDAWRINIDRAPNGTATGVRFGAVPYLAGMESYLVNRRSIGLVCDIIARDLDSGTHKPIDLMLRGAAERGELRAQCLFPFITSVLPGAFSSTREPRDNKHLSIFAMELLRHSFFVECDLPAALALADRLLPNPDEDLQERLHARIAAFVASDAFSVF